MSSSSGPVSHSMIRSWNANVTRKIGTIAIERDDQTGPELVEVLDERRLLGVVETARKPPTQHP